MFSSHFVPTVTVMPAELRCPSCGKSKLARQRACGSCLLREAGASYDPERHDSDSIFYDGSYTGPSERELMGGCNRCGGMDDCYCDG